MALRTFVRGSSVYKCRVCNRSTRATAAEQVQCEGICAQCFELAGIENAFSDYGAEEAFAEYGTLARRLLAELAAKPDADTSAWEGLTALLVEQEATAVSDALANADRAREQS